MRSIILYFFVFFCIFLGACQNSFLDLHQYLCCIDTMEIVFYEGTKTNNEPIFLKDRGVIKHFTWRIEWTKTIEAEKVKNCKKDGKIIFHRKNVNRTILSTEFSFQKDCLYIYYTHKGKKWAVPFKKEYALEFLEYAKEYPEAVY
jgi:hypothetical protein